MERFDRAYKGLNCHVNGHPHTRCYKCPYWGTGPHGSSECSALAVDALAMIQQQQERIKELEAAIAEWEKFAPFLYVHGMLPEPPKEDRE